MANGRAKLARSLVVDAAAFAASERSADQVMRYIETGDFGSAEPEPEQYDPDAVKTLFNEAINGRA
jgi:hypothetical protein